MKKSLRERTEELGNSLPFMKGREKGDQSELIGTIITITDFGFLEEGEDKKYVAYIIKEDPAHFYFGGQVLTDNLQELEEDGYGIDIRKEGLPVLFTEMKSKNKRTYTNVTFYPEEKGK